MPIRNTGENKMTLNENRWNCLRLEKASGVPMDEPTLDTLIVWSNAGYCKATDGCKVEPYGTCEHGCESWLLNLGCL